MTVNPGFGHQHFIHRTLPKITRVREIIDRTNPMCELEVDGGIDAACAALASSAGADVFVAGSSVFGRTEEITTAMNSLTTAIVRNRQAFVRVNTEQEEICSWG